MWVAWAYPAIALPESIEGKLFLVGLVVVCLLSGIFGLKDLETAMAIRQTEPVSIDKAPAGELVEIEGKIGVGDEQFVGGLSNDRMVVREYEFQKWRANRAGGEWKTVESTTDLVPFLVNDNTGTAAVDPTTASIQIEDDPWVGYISKGRRPPEGFTQHLDIPTEDLPWSPDDRVEQIETHSNDVEKSGLAGTEALRIKEQGLWVGETVHVRGETSDPPRDPTSRPSSRPRTTNGRRGRSTEGVGTR